MTSGIGAGPDVAPVLATAFRVAPAVLPAGAWSEGLLAVTPASLAAGAGAVGALMAMRRVRPRGAAAMVCAGIVLGAAAGAVTLESQDSRLRAAADRREQRLRRGLEAPPASPRGQVLWKERVDRRTCGARRVFVATRYDRPLALQGLPYDTLVSEATPSALQKGDLRRARPGGMSCDYALVSGADLASGVGVPVLNEARKRATLEPIAPAGALRVLYLRPTPADGSK